jgi:hypothetical protein
MVFFTIETSRLADDGLSGYHAPWRWVVENST